MYKLSYYADFVGSKDNKYRIEIYKDTTQTVVSTELTLSANAIQIRYNSDELFQPLKQSGCTVNILTDRVLTDLFTGKLNDVILKVYENNSLFWFGFLTPNLYSSEYNSDLDSLSLEFIDCISQLDNVKFNNLSGINDFYTIIQKAFLGIDPQKTISKIYLHNSLKINDSNNLLNNLYIQTRNFLDEGNEPQSYKSVIEDILKYMGMTLIQFKDSFYIVDYEALKDGNFSFTQYDLSDNSSTTTTITKDYRHIKDIGIAEANGTISLGNIYTKVNVVANTNPITTCLPDVMDDWKNQNADENKYYEQKKNFNNEEYVLLAGYFKNENENIDYTQPLTLKGAEIKEITNANVDTIHQGIFLQKVDQFKTSEGDPSSLKWSDYISMVLNGGQLTSKSIKLNMSSGFVGKGGYLILNIDYKLSTSNRANDIIDSDIKNNTYHGKDKTGIMGINSRERRGYSDDLFPVTLCIGGSDPLYYMGDDIWEKESMINIRVNDNYYRHPLLAKSTGTYYGIWRDKWNRYEFVTESVYNSSTGKKITGKGNYSFLSSNNEIFCTDIYYMECNYRYSFFVRHTNKEGDTIYGASRRLNNTVSFRYNIVDSEDGVAIKLPIDKILTGDIKMTLYAPNVLGSLINYDSDTFDHRCVGCHISNLSLKYSATASTTDIYGLNKTENDILYSNVIDASYVAEFDDIEMKVNTYSPDIVSYSYVLTKDGSDYDFVENLTRGTESKKMEEYIIERYYKHYSKPKFIYGNILKKNNLTPLSIVYSDALDKDMVIDSITYDLGDESAELTLKEI